MVLVKNWVHIQSFHFLHVQDDTLDALNDRLFFRVFRPFCGFLQQLVEPSTQKQVDIKPGILVFDQDSDDLDVLCKPKNHKSNVADCDYYEERKFSCFIEVKICVDIERLGILIFAWDKKEAAVDSNDLGDQREWLNVV